MLSITTALQHRLSYKQSCVCMCGRVCVPKRIKEKSKKDKEERKKTEPLTLQNSCNHFMQESNKYTCLLYFTFLNVEHNSFSMNSDNKKV